MSVYKLRDWLCKLPNVKQRAKSNESQMSFRFFAFLLETLKTYQAGIQAGIHISEVYD